MSAENGSATYTELTKSNPQEEDEEELGLGLGRGEDGLETGEEDKKKMKKKKKKRRRRRRWCICCASLCGILVATTVILLTILGLTVLKPRDPKLEVTEIKLEEFEESIGLNLPPTIRLNVTLGLVVRVENPNLIGFRYGNSTSRLLYRGVEVGRIPIPSGSVPGRDSAQIVSHLELMADRLLDTPDLLPDLLSGSLRFASATVVSGRVDLLLFHPRVEATSRCDIRVSVLDHSTQFACDYNVKL